MVTGDVALLRRVDDVGVEAVVELGAAEAAEDVERLEALGREHVAGSRSPHAVVSMERRRPRRASWGARFEAGREAPRDAS